MESEKLLLVSLCPEWNALRQWGLCRPAGRRVSCNLATSCVSCGDATVLVYFLIFPGAILFTSFWFCFLGFACPTLSLPSNVSMCNYPSRKFRLRTWDSGGCVGVGGDEATIHRKRGRAGDGREKEIKVPDINSTCLLGFSRSRSFEGHTTTALIAKVSRTKGLWGKVTMHFIPQGFISIIQL